MNNANNNYGCHEEEYYILEGVQVSIIDHVLFLDHSYM